MAKLNTTQIEELLNSNSQVPCVKKNSSFYEFAFEGVLDGYKYHCNTQRTANTLEDGVVKTNLLALTDTSTADLIRSAFEGYFADVNYKGSKDVFDYNTTVDIN